MKLTDIKQALAAYQTGHYPKHGDASRTLETLTKALPNLIAIAEAAGQLQRERTHPVPDRVMIRDCSDRLTTALNELEKA